MKLKNFYAYGYSEFNSIVAISADTDTCRYHIWIDRNTLESMDTTIHKNPPLDNPKAFDHRALSQNAACNLDIMKQLRAAAPSAIAGAKFEFDAKKAAEREADIQRKRAQALKDAAPQLYKVVKALQNWYHESNTQEGPHAGSLLFEDEHSLLHHLDAAIAKAEAYTGTADATDKR